jgi:hypothetical protein
MRNVEHILFCAKQIPQLRTTAAAVRSINLLQALHQAYNPKRITLISPQQQQQQYYNSMDNDLSTLFPPNAIQLMHVPINQNTMNTTSIPPPQLTVFDTFVAEEYYGTDLVYNQFPESITICDTQDLKSLRLSRGEYITQNKDKLDIVFSEEYRKLFPKANDPTISRELRSILRCDLSLIVSSAELELLKNICKVPAEKMVLAPFIYTADIAMNTQSTATNDIETKRSFHERKHFFHIGTFRHEPNRDAVLLLKRYIWPKIRSQLPDAQLHIYGSFISKDISTLADRSTGFILKNLMQSMDEVEKYRVNLAPLRFGAGIKGKIADGWAQHTPCVTTWVGAEGMYTEQFPFGGIIAEESWDNFVDACVALYTDEQLWNNKSIASQNLKNHPDSPLSYNTGIVQMKPVIDKLLADQQHNDYLKYVLNQNIDYKFKYIQQREQLKQHSIQNKEYES